MAISGPYRSSDRSIRYCLRLPYLPHTRRTILCLAAVSAEAAEAARPVARNQRSGPSGGGHDSTPRLYSNPLHHSSRTARRSG